VKVKLVKPVTTPLLKSGPELETVSDYNSQPKIQSRLKYVAKVVGATSSEGLCRCYIHLFGFMGRK